MNNLKLGQYVHGNSLLYRLDPRTKILCCIIIVVSVLINDSWYFLGLHVLLMLAAVVLSGMKWKYFIDSLAKIRYFLLITFLFQLFLIPGEPIAGISKVVITHEGLVLGTINLFRLLIIYVGSIVLLMTTSPLKLSAGLDSLLGPLSKLRIPVNNFSSILGMSFRFLPTLVDEITTIKNAQTSRGAPFNSPMFFTRLKSYMAVIIPLFEASLVKAEALAEAMDSRGYTGRPNKLRLSRLTFGAADTVIMIFMAAVLLAGTALSYIIK